MGQTDRVSGGEEREREKSSGSSNKTQTHSIVYGGKKDNKRVREKRLRREALQIEYFQILSIAEKKLIYRSLKYKDYYSYPRIM